MCDVFGMREGTSETKSNIATGLDGNGIPKIEESKQELVFRGMNNVLIAWKEYTYSGMKSIEPRQ